MFYFDEDQEENVERGRLDRFSDEDDDSFTFSSRFGGRMSVISRPSDGLGIHGEWEDSEDEGEEAKDEPSQLVPMKMSVGGTTVGTRRKRTSSRSKASSFYDYYTMKGDSLGAGAYGSVSTCVQKTSGEEMAVKLVSKKESGHSKSRILREVETLKVCDRHPNIVQLIDWFEDEDYFYMVFEKMHGGPLLSHIQARGRFTESEASMVTKDIANALMFLHDQGIAHRDVKPENILCTSPEGVSPVKLCDLDLASKAVSSSPPRLSSVASEPDLASPVGSAEFMAPEVVDAFVGESLKYDKRCDMWSLGVIVYIMLCGYPPFYGGDCEGEACGWDEGEACDECQQRLFARIQRGEYDFPEEEWDVVSEEAKDLIRSLLKRDARKRLTAEEVLTHPWITRGAPNTQLQTPTILFRNDSTRDVHQMTETFNMVSRMPGMGDSGEVTPCNSPPQTSPVIIQLPLLQSAVQNARIESAERLVAAASQTLLACQQSVARMSLSELFKEEVNV